MRVLVACEFSGAVRDAFAALGHDAWSCDLLPSETSGNHFTGPLDVFLSKSSTPIFDLMIAHPPCTDLSVSGARYFAQKRASGAQQKALEFVRWLMNGAFVNIPRICVENPVGIISSAIRKPDQIIQPYQFGDDASKQTCLWLNGLAPLRPTQFVEPRMIDGKPRWSNQCDSGQNKLGPSPERAANRARTYPGIARAMAQQWGTA